MAYWACAQLVPYREQLALHTLALAGYETYRPLLRARRVSYGRRLEVTHPLFPGYAFIAITNGWWSARWSPGVAKLVLDGAAPAKVPDAVITEIRSRERGGLVELPSKLKRGDPIRILKGPFADRVGLYDGMPARERITVLLQLLGSERRVSLRAGDVEAV
jgi:transcriptional antiterminator RfaH